MTHADIINKWPNLAEFAADLAMPYGTAKAMRRRGSIPVEYWALLVEKAAMRGLHDVTLQLLIDWLPSCKTRMAEAAE